MKSVGNYSSEDLYDDSCGDVIFLSCNEGDEISHVFKVKKAAH